jgi:hypothetical protein
MRRSSSIARALALVGAAALLVSFAPGIAVAHEPGRGSHDGPPDGGLSRSLAGVRAATAPFRRVATAEAAGYGSFYVCTDEPGIGAMGQHYVNGALVADPAIDARHPEAMVYAPTARGLRLAAVEYIVMQADWDALHAAPPRLFGHDFGLVTTPNRYGLPAFYELHAWVWKWNPLGMFYEWNPRVHCP